MKALLVVDLQNDFLPGGALAVREGDQIVEPINALIKSGFFDFIVASKDWHPENHGSFAQEHGGEIGQKVQLAGLEQVLWPVHCVQGTPGADFPESLAQSFITKVIHKGTDSSLDSYSVFYDNAHRRSTELGKWLEDRGVTDLYIAGLATDYCVKFTVLDALSEGFKTFLIADCCRAVNLQNNDKEKACEQMLQAGACFVESEEILQSIRKRKREI